MKGLPQSVLNEEIAAQRYFNKHWGIAYRQVKNMHKTCEDSADAMLVTSLAAATIVFFARQDHDARVQALRFMARQMQQVLEIVEDIFQD